MKDLLILVADKNMEFLMKGLLPRIPVVEGLREFDYDIFIHPERDPGVFNHSADFLRPFLNTHQFVIAILDRIGSGQEHLLRDEIEDQIIFFLSRNGWDDRAVPIVIDPELENWIWVNQQIMHETIIWSNQLNLFDWLHENNLKNTRNLKPDKPKEAFDEALKLSGTPRSSSLYHEISCRASYQNCQDPAFLKMLDLFRQWFS